MAASFNEVTLIGRLGRDPEIRTTQAGQKIANLRVATSESWNDRSSGERKERTEWHAVAVMNDKLADIAERFLRKGSLALFRGQLQTRKWTDQSGQEKYSTEVVIGKFKGDLVMLDSRSADSGSETHPPARPAPSQSAPARPSGGGDLDDEIPFDKCWQ